MNNWFEDLENEWRYDTFMAVAFNDERDFDEYLDDEETGISDEAFDNYSDEINDYLFPVLKEF